MSEIAGRLRIVWVSHIFKWRINFGDTEHPLCENIVSADGGRPATISPIGGYSSAPNIIRNRAVIVSRRVWEAVRAAPNKRHDRGVRDG
jgi:hypothetical protein